MFAFASAISLHAMAAPDMIQATGGPITIQPITHAAVQIKHGNQVITVDPTMMGGDYNTLPKADFILDHRHPRRSPRPADHEGVEGKHDRRRAGAAAEQVKGAP